MRWLTTKKLKAQPPLWDEGNRSGQCQENTLQDWLWKVVGSLPYLSLDNSTYGHDILLSEEFFGKPYETIDLGLFEDLDHLQARGLFL